jgi:hypothetical protein
MPNYDGLVKAFDRGDVLFGLSSDLASAKDALNAAYGDGASFWGAFSRMGRKHNKKAKKFSKKTDVLLQSDLTNAVASPPELGFQIKEALPSIRQARAQGNALHKPPMSAVYKAPPSYIGTKLPHEQQRGVEFADFLDGHEKFDPKLMGGHMKAGSYAPLGEKKADRVWIVASRKSALQIHLIGDLDRGNVLHLKNGRDVAPREKGKNKTFVEQHWDDIDWDKYDLYDCLNDSNIANVVNYKVWKRTSKAGLEFQTAVRGRVVHFLLDTFMAGDGMQSAVSKGGGHGKSITAGEIRWLYRNWAKPQVSKNVRFWTVHKEELPPWEMAAYRDLWAGYVPKAWREDRTMALASALTVHE